MVWRETTFQSSDSSCNDSRTTNGRHLLWKREVPECKVGEDMPQQRTHSDRSHDGSRGCFSRSTAGVPPRTPRWEPQYTPRLRSTAWRELLSAVFLSRDDSRLDRASRT